MQPPTSSLTLALVAHVPGKGVPGRHEGPGVKLFWARGWNRPLPLPYKTDPKQLQALGTAPTVLTTVWRTPPKPFPSGEALGNKARPPRGDT